MKRTFQGDLKNTDMLNSLKKDHELYRVLLKTSPEAILLTDLEGKIILVSERILQFTGYDSIEFFIGKNATEFIAPSDVERAKNNLEKTIQTGKLEREKYHLLRKDGSYYLGELNARLIKNKDGKPLAFLGTITDVTEHQRLEDSVAERETIYRELYENAPVGLWKSRIEDGKFLRANRIVANIVGYDSVNALKENCTAIDLFDSKTRQNFLNELKSKGETKEFKAKFKDLDGNKKTILVSAKIDRDNMTIEGVFIDISDLKMAQKALKSSEQQYKAVLDSIVDPMHVVDKELRIVYINYAFMEWLKALNLPKDCFGKTIFECFPFLKVDIKDQYEQVFQKGKMVHTVEVTKIKGEEFITETRKYPIFNDNKEVIRIITIIRDVTEASKIQQQIIESEEKFRTIFEAIPDIFLMVNKKAEILEYSGEEEKFYVPPSEFLGKKLSSILPDELAGKSEDAIKKTIKTRQPVNLEYNLPIGGELMYFEARHLFFSEDQVGIFIRNITERKKAEIIITREVERLKEIDEMRRNLITRVSHEIKTPLMAINGAIELLMDEWKESAPQNNNDLLSMIFRNTERLNTLVRRLLDISRIESSSLILDKQNHDLCQMIREASEEMAILLSRREIGLVLDIPESLEIDVDKVRFEQVIINILSNAIKNTPPEGRIDLVLKEGEDDVKIIIEDNGVGLTEKELKIIFKRFGKIERHEEGLEYLNIQGSGLGLFISREIVKLHGGTIQAESKGRNKGSRFTITLPIS